MNPQHRASLVTAPAAAGARLDHYLAQVLTATSRKAIKRALDAGQVFVDGRCVVRAGMLLRGGERIELTLDGAPPPALVPPLTILWQDDSLLAINKPAGLPAHLTVGDRPNALNQACEFLAASGGREQPILLHRLDADTTGLLLFALTRAANRSLSRQFSAHQIKKTYLALVRGTPPEHFVVSNHLKAGVRGRTVAVTSGGLAAQTDFRTLASHDGVALVAAQPRTGRTHQIRAHLAGCGYPLLGDPLYGGETSLLLASGRVLVPRHLLHAHSLVLIHPQSQLEQVLTAPLPEDFLFFLHALEIDTAMLDFALQIS